LLTALDETLVFVADDGHVGPTLWRSDGTKVGTARVADLHDIDRGTPPFSSKCALTELGDKLFFGADDRSAGNELWSSDGTTTGTVLVKDIRPGPDSALPGELTPFGDALFFAADDGTHGRELWKTDGTGAGTMLVGDIVPGGASSSPAQLTAVEDRLFFTVGFDRDTELWVSDGTAAGTTHLQDFFFGTDLTAVAGTLYFTSGYSLWKSDGTAAGTVMVAGFHPASGQYQPNRLRAVGDRLFFYAKEPGGSAVRLWTVSGTAGPVPVAFDELVPSQPTRAGGLEFFSAGEPEHGRELWVTDAPESEPRLVLDIYPGPADSNPADFSEVPGGVVFTACNGDGCRLWTSDGTSEGTRPLAGFGLAPPSQSVCSAHTRLPTRSLVVAGGLAFFDGEDFAYGLELRAAPLSGRDCTGDCDGDGAVTITELVRIVRLALGTPGDSCSIGTPDDAIPSISVLMTAVNHALHGCF
jgi:ELWxxDGT repeat protein